MPNQLRELFNGPRDNQPLKHNWSANSSTPPSTTELRLGIYFLWTALLKVARSSHTHTHTSLSSASSALPYFMFFSRYSHNPYWRHWTTLLRQWMTHLNNERCWVSCRLITLIVCVLELHRSQPLHANKTCLEVCILRGPVELTSVWIRTSSHVEYSIDLQFIIIRVLVVIFVSLFIELISSSSSLHSFLFIPHRY